MLVLRVLVVLAAVAGVAAAQPTYSKEVSRILQAKCQSCHRPNDIAPFTLMNYEEAQNYAEDIKRVVEQRYMPPWKPVAGHGKFLGDTSLSAEERQTILDWVAAGAPEGDKADLPEEKAPQGEWVLGEPDLVVKMPEAYTPPRGKDMYRCFVLPTGLEENKFVSAVDVLPGNRSVVHHVILYLDTTGEAEQLDAKEEGPGYTCYGGPGTSLTPSPGSNLSLTGLLNIGGTLGGWAPGQRPFLLPDGKAMFLDKNARIVMQVHYYSTRLTSEDQTRVGLYYSRTPVEKRLLYVPMVPLDNRGRLSMNIPAGAEKHEVAMSFSLPPLPLFDVSVVNIYPHMHLLGTDVKTSVQRRGEREPESLIWIDNWDFNWQGAYYYEQPVKVPAGSTLRATCTYNNSKSNPRNPSAEPKSVTWGEGTEDEMCVVFLGITFDRENLLAVPGLNATGRTRR